MGKELMLRFEGCLEGVGEGVEVRVELGLVREGVRDGVEVGLELVLVREKGGY